MRRCLRSNVPKSKNLVKETDNKNQNRKQIADPNNLNNHFLGKITR